MLPHGGRSRGFKFCVFSGYNWCGPGCSGPGAPINAVDAACKAHDFCYKTYGNRYACDQELLNRLQFLMNPHTLEGRQARTIYNFMKMKIFFF